MDPSEVIKELVVSVYEQGRNSKGYWASIELRATQPHRALLDFKTLEVALFAEGREVWVGSLDIRGRASLKLEGLREEAARFEAIVRWPIFRATAQLSARDKARFVGDRTSEKKASPVGSFQEVAPWAEWMPEMIQIYPGSFRMGNGGNFHRVEISRPLLVADTPVTQELYKAVMEKNPSRFKGILHPVERVSWWDAVTFCNRLSELEELTLSYGIDEKNRRVSWRRTANGYRLPTEAEWEFLAKGRDETPFSGYHILDQVGWYNDNSRGRTWPVKSKKPNRNKIYDMSGNVWEWVYDTWNENAFSGRGGRVTLDPVDENDAVNWRCRRGGCWLAFAGSCKVSYRFWAPSSQQSDDTGFRIVRSL